MKHSKLVRVAALVAATSLITSCGSGSESSDTTVRTRNVSIPVSGLATVALIAGIDSGGTIRISTVPLATAGTVASTELFTDTGGYTTAVTGLVYDSQNRVVYWATQELRDLKIRSRQLDGGSTNTLYSIPNSYPSGGLGLDAANNRLVWSGTESSTGKIWMGDTSGTSYSTLVSTYNAKGLTVSTNKIYGLIGLNVRTISISPFSRLLVASGVGADAHTVMTDETNSKLYYANGYSTSPQIYLVNTDGLSSPAIYTTPSRGVVSLAMRTDGSVVWADGIAPLTTPTSSASGISIVDPLDPMVSRVFYPSPDVRLTAMWLVEQPSTNVEAELDGDGLVGSEHSCIDASWSSDLPAQRLSRSPEVGREYAWYVDGEVVAGAGDRVFVPTSPGSLKCVVTASNLAGSTSSESLEVAVADPPSTTPSTPSTTPSSSSVVTTVPSSSETDGGSLSGGGASPVVTSPTTTVAPRYKSISVKWSYNSSRKLLTGTFKKVSGARTYSMTMTGATKKTVKCATSRTRVTCKATLKKGVNVITVNAKNASKVIIAQKRASKTVR